MTSRIAARSSGVASWLSAKITDRQCRLDSLATARLYTVGSGIRPRRQHLSKLALHKVQRHGIFDGIACRKPARYSPLINRPSQFLAVIVRAVAARQESEPVRQLRQLAPE